MSDSPSTATRAAGTRSPVSGLYVVTSEHPELGRTHLDVALAAIEGGARVVQYRDKLRHGAELLAIASAIRELCACRGVAFVMNDHAEVAMQVRADGLHLGQRDLKSRALWRPTWEAFLGITAWSPELAAEARELGADYIGSGPVRPTTLKTMTREPLGFDGLRAVCEVGVPVAAIGGLGVADVAAVFGAGASAMCVMSGIGVAADPQETVREIVSAIDKIGVG